MPDPNHITSEDVKRWREENNIVWSSPTKRAPVTRGIPTPPAPPTPSTATPTPTPKTSLTSEDVKRWRETSGYVYPKFSEQGVTPKEQRIIPPPIDPDDPLSKINVGQAFKLESAAPSPTIPFTNRKVHPLIARGGPLAPVVAPIASVGKGMLDLAGGFGSAFRHSSLSDKANEPGSYAEQIIENKYPSGIAPSAIVRFLLLKELAYLQDRPHGRPSNIPADQSFLDSISGKEFSRHLEAEKALPWQHQLASGLAFDLTNLIGTGFITKPLRALGLMKAVPPRRLAPAWLPDDPDYQRILQTTPPEGTVDSLDPNSFLGLKPSSTQEATGLGYYDPSFGINPFVPEVQFPLPPQVGQGIADPIAGIYGPQPTSFPPSGLGVEGLRSIGRGIRGPGDRDPFYPVPEELDDPLFSTIDDLPDNEAEWLAQQQIEEALELPPLVRGALSDPEAGIYGAPAETVSGLGPRPSALPEPGAGPPVEVTVYHGARIRPGDPIRLPDVEEFRFGGLHFGTAEAAQQRLTQTPSGRIGGIPGVGEQIIPAQIRLEKPLGSIDEPISETELFLIINVGDRLNELKAQGFDGIIYRNIQEDPGSVSYVVFNRRSIISQGDEVLSPIAPSPIEDVPDPGTFSLQSAMDIGPAGEPISPQGELGIQAPEVTIDPLIDTEAIDAAKKLRDDAASGQTSFLRTDVEDTTNVPDVINEIGEIPYESRSMELESQIRDLDGQIESLGSKGSGIIRPYQMVGGKAKRFWAQGHTNQELEALAADEGLNPRVADWFADIDPEQIAAFKRGDFKRPGAPTQAYLKRERSRLYKEYEIARIQEDNLLAERRIDITDQTNIIGDPPNVPPGSPQGPFFDDDSRNKALVIIRKFLSSPELEEAQDLTMLARSKERGQRFADYDYYYDDLIERGLGAEDARRGALIKMSGPYTQVGTDVPPELLIPMIRDFLFDEIRRKLPGRIGEQLSAGTALRKLLNGEPIARTPGTRGGSQYHILVRVFGEDLVNDLVKESKPFEDIIDAKILESQGLPPRPPGERRSVTGGIPPEDQTWGASRMFGPLRTAGRQEFGVPGARGEGDEFISETPLESPQVAFGEPPGPFPQSEWAESMFNQDSVQRAISNENIRRSGANESPLVINDELTNILYRASDQAQDYLAPDDIEQLLSFLLKSYDQPRAGMMPIGGLDISPLGFGDFRVFGKDFDDPGTQVVRRDLLGIGEEALEQQPARLIPDEPTGPFRAAPRIDSVQRAINNENLRRAGGYRGPELRPLGEGIEQEAKLIIEPEFEQQLYRWVDDWQAHGIDVDESLAFILKKHGQPQSGRPGPVMRGRVTSDVSDEADVGSRQHRLPVEWMPRERPMSDATRAVKMTTVEQLRAENNMMARLFNLPLESKYDLVGAPLTDEARLHYDIPSKVVEDRLDSIVPSDKADMLAWAKFMGYQITDLFGLMKANVASTDLSYLRQVSPLIVRNPVPFAKSFKDALRSVWSQKYADDLNEEILNHPYYPLYEQFDLDFLRPLDQSSVEASKRVEDLIVLGEQGWTRPFAQIARYVPWINISGRAYISGTNSMLWNMFKGHVRNVEKINMGIAEKTITPQPGLMAQLVPGRVPQSFDMARSIQDYGKFLGDYSGRGPINRIIGGRKRSLGPSSRVTNALFFSLRLAIGRFLMPRHLFARDKYVRQAAWANTLAYVGGMTSMIMGGWQLGWWDVETDSASADFMKIRIGNTRLDPWGGTQQYAVLYWRLLTAMNDENFKSSKTGETGYLAPGDAVKRFATNKRAPAIGQILDGATGRDIFGQPIDRSDWTYWLKENLMLAVMDVYEAYENEGLIGPESVLSTGGIFGGGVSTYDRPPTIEEQNVQRGRIQQVR